MWLPQEEVEVVKGVMVTQLEEDFREKMQKITVVEEETEELKVLEDLEGLEERMDPNVKVEMDTLELVTMVMLEEALGGTEEELDREELEDLHMEILLELYPILRRLEAVLE